MLLSWGKKPFLQFILILHPLEKIVKICISYLDLADLKMQAQEGLLRHKSIGIDTYMDKLVGFGSEGASVNCGKKEGVKALLQESKEWLVFGWFVAHRLELSLKDSLKATSFTDVDNIISHMYYLFKKSPNKLSQLKELVSLSENTDFHEGGFCPRKASGISYNHPNFFIIFNSICCYVHLCTQASFWIWTTWLFVRLLSVTLFL